MSTTVDDDDREYLNYVSKAIHERHHEETWRQIQELFRRVTAQLTDLRRSNLRLALRLNFEMAQSRLDGELDSVFVGLYGGLL